MITSQRVADMEALLVEIRDYPIDGAVTNESLWRAFGRWTTQARMILGPPIPVGDAGYVVNQRIDKPDAFSEEVKQRQAEFLQYVVDTMDQIGEAIKKDMEIAEILRPIDSSRGTV